jgi:geranylgeranyl diphosphate synthase, type II
LLGYSLELGAILADAPEGDRGALRDFGTLIGTGFQLKDDLLDAFADPKKFGKQVGGDILANKKTYLLIKALEKAEGQTTKDLLFWLNAKKFRASEKITAVKGIYNQLDIPATVETKINYYFRKGFESLERVTANTTQVSLLRNFTQDLIERQS